MTIQHRGQVTLQETNLLEIPTHDHDHDHGLGPSAHDVPHYEAADPHEIRERLGYFGEPSPLPSGFRLATSGIVMDRQASAFYQRDDGAVIEMRQDEGPFILQVPPRTARPVTISGHPGYIVRGDWVEIQNSSGGVIKPIHWNPDEGISVIFETGERWVSIQLSQGAEELDEADMIRVAESI